VNVETMDFLVGPVTKESKEYKEKGEIKEILDNQENLVLKV
jgi:hypothetical protein